MQTRQLDKHLSLWDTGTKIGTNDVQDIPFKKSMLAIKIFKMATNFQDGRQCKPDNFIRIFNFVIQAPKLTQTMFRTYLLRKDVSHQKFKMAANIQDGRQSKPNKLHF